MQMEVPSSGKLLARKTFRNKFIGSNAHRVKATGAAFALPISLNPIRPRARRQLKVVALIIHFARHAPRCRIPVAVVG